MIIWSAKRIVGVFVAALILSAATSEDKMLLPGAPLPSLQPATSAVGPQSTITCPASAVDISPGVSIQDAIDRHEGNTTFCLRAGTHFLRSSITPKTGNTFVGEYGAVLDGSGWTASDP